MPASRTPKPTSASARSVEVIQAPNLSGIPWLVHGFSTRIGGISRCPFLDEPCREYGDLNLGKTEWDRDKNVRENRRRFLEWLGASEMKLLMLRQIHSDVIRIVDSSLSPAAARTANAARPLAGDGMITDRAGLLLGILAADCLPILLADVRQQVIGALHCGWRGTLRRLAQKAVGTMRQQFGARQEDLWAAIGPGIRSCCYAVGSEVVDEFHSQFAYADQLLDARVHLLTPLEIKHALFRERLPRPFGLIKRRRIYLDLVQANVIQLREAGVPAGQIFADAPCTSCHPERFFSHRRDAVLAGRMLGVVGIRRK